MTQAFIAQAMEDGAVRYIGCMVDGHPDRHVPLLARYYTTEEKVNRLMELGHLYRLREEIGEAHQFGQEGSERWCQAFGRDICYEGCTPLGGGLDSATVAPSLESAINQMKVQVSLQQEEAWLYHFEDGEWRYCEVTQVQADKFLIDWVAIKPVAPQICALPPLVKQAFQQFSKTMPSEVDEVSANVAACQSVLALLNACNLRLRQQDQHCWLELEMGDKTQYFDLQSPEGTDSLWGLPAISAQFHSEVALLMSQILIQKAVIDAAQKQRAAAQESLMQLVRRNPGGIPTGERLFHPYGHYCLKSRTSYSFNSGAIDAIAKMVNDGVVTIHTLLNALLSGETVPNATALRTALGVDAFSRLTTVSKKLVLEASPNPELLQQDGVADSGTIKTQKC